MRFFILIIFLMSPLLSYGSDYYTELRLGVIDSYKKDVKHSTLGTLQGTFKGINLGVRGGVNLAQHSVFLEINPEQSVEIKAANELARVTSFFVGYHYRLDMGVYFGGQLGMSFFELVKGLNGITFTDNPKTKGLTYGVNVGYKYNITPLFYVAGDVAYNMGSYKNDGPVGSPIQSIEIQNQMQLNILLGFDI